MYRDPLAGHRVRVAELRARIEDRHRHATAFEHSLWSRAERAERAQLEEAVRAERDDSVEAIAALEMRLAALDAFWAEQLPRARARRPMAEMQPWPPSDDPVPWLIEERWMRVIGDALQAFAGPGTQARRLGDADYGAAMEVEGVRVGVRVRHDAMTPVEAPLVRCAVRAAVSVGMPSWQLAPQGMIARLRDSLGLLPEAKLDDVAFDDAFIVRCEQDLARQLFDKPIRRLLVQHVEATPCVQVKDGHVEVGWSRSVALGQLAEVFEPQLDVVRALHLRVKALSDA